MSDTPQCGSFGCTLPRGHNRGQADVPENHRPADPVRCTDRPDDPPRIIAETLHDQGNDLSDCAYYERQKGLNDDGTCSYGCYDEPRCVTCVPGEEGWPREVLAERYASLLPSDDDEPWGPSASVYLDALAALEALHADGWRIVRSQVIEGPDAVLRDPSLEVVQITEEWTPDA